MGEPKGMVRTLSIRDAARAAGFEPLARADFGGAATPFFAAAGDVLIRIVPGAAGAAEAAVAARLDHPNTLQLLEIRSRPGYRVIVFQGFRGHALARTLASVGRLDPQRALGVALGAARALAHAHARGIAHGAVSAETVALGADGEVKLVGFAAAPPPRLTGTVNLGPPRRDDPPRFTGTVNLEGSVSRDDDLAALGRTLRAAIGGDRAGTAARFPEALAPLARIAERCMRLRPELGFYPDAAAVVAAVEGAARRLGETRPDMTGRFAEAELFALLQMIELTGRSGRIELVPAEAPGAGGAMAIRDGKIVAARAGARRGGEAALELLALREGRFRLWFGPVEARGGAEVPIRAALLEAHRRKDEAGREIAGRPG